MANGNDMMRIWDAIQPMAKNAVERQTRDSVRMKKMVVTTAYSAATKTIGVAEPFGETIQLPVFGGLNAQELAVGTAVWVISPYSSFSNALVFMRGDGGLGDSPGQDGEPELLKERPLLPVYIGDYTCHGSYLPSCCLRMGNYYYTIDALESTDATEQQSNAGKIRKFDIVNNVEVIDDTWPKTADVGHANSIAYDPVDGIIYVCPLSDYVQGAEAYYFYRFDSDFNALEKEETITWKPHMVTYDPVEGALYAFAFNGNRLYKKDRATGAWSVYGTISTPKANTAQNTTFNQDLAIYDGYWFRSCVVGDLVWGKLVPGGAASILGGYSFAGVDSYFKYHIGELEGMEFSADGHLYAMCFTGLGNTTKNAFVTELPIGMARTDTTGFLAPDLVFAGTLTLSEATQIEFAQRIDHIRAITQIEARVLRYNISEIHIPADNNVVEECNVRINDKVKLRIDGTYTCKEIYVYAGVLNISNDVGRSLDAPGMTFTGTGIPIHLLRTGELMITGASTLYIAHPNYSGERLVDVGYDYNRTTIRIRPVDCSTGSSFYVGTTYMRNDAVYRGSQAIQQAAQKADNLYISNSYITQSDYSSGFGAYMISASLAVTVINIHVTNSIPQNTEVNFARSTSLKPVMNESVWVVGSEGTRAEIRVSSTSGRVYITPLSGATVAGEYFGVTLTYPM